jgi:hypothetical protein
LFLFSKAGNTMTKNVFPDRSGIRMGLAVFRADSLHQLFCAIETSLAVHCDSVDCHIRIPIMLTR